MPSDLRAIGIIRVSQVKGRKGESFSSPKDQRAAIERLCAEHEWKLIAAHDELQVSGNALLEDRPGLSQAVTAVLTGAADVIVGAHSERLWWSHEVRAQVLRLVEGAGGEVWAVDTGRLSNGSAAEDFSGEVRTSADRFTRRQNAEKSRVAVERAVRRGVMPWGTAPPGYMRGDDGVLVPSPDADAVREAFRMRLDGATVAAVRTYLAERGVQRAYSKITLMLSNRIYLGEIHFGALVNLHAHEPLVDADTFRRIQSVRVPSGRRAKSERLLARLGVLRCASCGSRMIVGTQRQHGRSYPFYRCGRVREDCAERPAISAVLVERLVTDEVRRALDGIVGRASAGEDAIEAEAVLERAQADLDAAIRAFAVVQDEPVALERLMELRETRDAAAGHAERLRGLRSALEVTALRDWDSLSLPAKRGLIQAVVARVVVSRGRGAGRVRVELRE